MKGRISKLLIVAVLSISTAGIARAEPAAAEATWKAYDDPVADVRFSPDGKTLATLGGHDDTLKLFDVATHRELGSATGLADNGRVVRFTPNGKFVLAMARGDGIVVADAVTGKVARTLDLKTVGGHANAFDVSPDGKVIAVVGRGSLRILSLADGSEIKNWEVHTNYGIDAVAFSPDGKFVATASTEHKADVVEWETGKIPFECPVGLNGVAVAFAPDGKTLYTADSGGVLKAFDLTSGDGKTLSDGKVVIGCVVPMPDGKSLFLGGTGQAPWQLALPAGTADEKPVVTASWNKALAVSPDGKTLAGGDNDGAITLWKPGTPAAPPPAAPKAPSDF